MKLVVSEAILGPTNLYRYYLRVMLNMKDIISFEQNFTSKVLDYSFKLGVRTMEGEIIPKGQGEVSDTDGFNSN